VETVQHNKQHTASSGESLQTAFGKAIRLELSVLVGADQVLLLLNVTVKNGKIQVGGGLVKVRLTIVCLENVYIRISIYFWAIVAR
jgi:hypothetical protein